MSITIVSRRPPHKGVSCVVFELGKDGANGRTVLVADGANCEEGIYDVRNPERTVLLRVIPIDGHWSCIRIFNSDLRSIECAPIDDDLDFPWWQRVVGVADVQEMPAHGIRIGIIDQLFEPCENLKHLRFVDSVARRKSVLGDLDDKSATHGQRVSCILGGRGPGEFRGIANGGDIHFVDSTFELNGQVVDRSSVDHAKVLDGIYRLSGTYKADLINLSCGFGNAVLPDLEDCIEEAADNGTLCICAAGNTANAPPEVPARFQAAIGVGGIGFTGVAPEGTIMQGIAQRASEHGQLGREFFGFGFVFHDVNTCSGEGVDVCAPSLGIVMRQRNGVISEYHGTSYASPIVAGVLACKLEKDDTYQRLGGRDRFNRARELLMEACCGLGLDPRKVGRGLPRF